MRSESQCDAGKQVDIVHLAGQAEVDAHIKHEVVSQGIRRAHAQDSANVRSAP